VKRVGILAGAFNPVTRAHVALARAARPMVDEIVCVIPRSYPHKELHGASIAQRIEMLELAGLHDRLEITGSGLFIDIARVLGRPGDQLFFICGADAAERVITWDYGDPHAIDRMLEEFSLLVAPRAARFAAPEHLRHRIQEIPMPDGYEEISSTEVRARLASGAPWEHLTPDSIADLVRSIYAR